MVDEIDKLIYLLRSDARPLSSKRAPSLQDSCAAATRELEPNKQTSIDHLGTYINVSKDMTRIKLILPNFFTNPVYAPLWIISWVEGVLW